METSPDHFTLQVGLVDRFGDNGTICAVICHRQPDTWEIDSWLMSCRVLNRKVEEAVCNRIAREAIAAGAKRLTGLYLPTPRNNIVANLFAQLGFVREDSPDNAQRWALNLETFQPFNVPVTEAA